MDRVGERSSLAITWSRWYRPTMFALAAVVVAVAVVEIGYAMFGPPQWTVAIGADLNLYTDQVRTVLAGGSWFHDRQLHGPYPLEWGDILYPPVTMLLFAPFLILPYLLWVIIPIGVTGWLLYRWQPAPWTWPVIALCVVWPSTLLHSVAGNPSLWVMLAVALGLSYRWPAVFVLLKPSFLPLALVGIGSRGWWIGLGVLAALSLPFLTDTLAYPGVVLGVKVEGGLLYSIWDLPLVLVPVIAWAGTKSSVRSGLRPERCS